MSVFEYFRNLDQKIFYCINTKLSAHWLDQPMVVVRTDITWIPLYLGMLLYFFFRHRSLVIPLVALSLLCFAITDYTSASLLKPFIHRLRPCYNHTVSAWMHHVIPCGGRYSMPSSHASNHFGLAALWFNIVYYANGKKWYWLWLWAALVCYAQMYVGVHFPADILFGAVIGTLAGNLCWRAYLYLMKMRPQLRPKK